MSADLQDRLSRIQTNWTQVLAPVDAADKNLLLCYYGAAFRYLLGIVKDATVAEELAQEFAVRFLAGQYRKVDRQRGRFRDFLKVCLRNLVHDHGRKQQKNRERQPADPEAFDPAAPEPEGGDPFADTWREEVLTRTWEALARFEAESGKPYCTVLRLKTEARLGQALDKPLSAEAVRQTLHRAREKFADLLLDEVQATLRVSDRDQLEDELIAIELIDYCRKALDRRFPHTA